MACRGRHRAHRDDQRPGEAARRAAGHGGAVHRDVHALLDVADRQPRGQQRALEGERAPDQERDQIRAPRNRRHLVDHLAVAVDEVAGEIGAQVRARGGERRLDGARIEHLEHRARPRVGDAEAQEVERVGLGQHDQVGLGEAGGERRGRPVERTRADRGADFGGRVHPSLCIVPPRARALGNRRRLRRGGRSEPAAVADLRADHDRRRRALRRLRGRGRLALAGLSAALRDPRDPGGARARPRVQARAAGRRLADRDRRRGATDAATPSRPRSPARS